MILQDIPVSDLRPGMQVWKENEKGTHWVPDVFLTDYLLSDSYPVREFVYGHRLQFKTSNGVNVTWHNCGRATVSLGRAANGTKVKK